MYTERILRHELATIYRDGREGFVWEQHESGGVTLDDLVRHRWTPYDMAFRASGSQAIGRSRDPHESLKRKVANGFGDLPRAGAVRRAPRVRSDP